MRERKWLRKTKRRFGKVGIWLERLNMYKKAKHGRGNLNVTGKGWKWLGKAKRERL